MPDLLVTPAVAPLRGSVPVPGDKSVTHRALLFGALAEGSSRVTGGGSGEDNLATISVLRALGVRVEEREREIVVHGVGLGGLRAPEADLDCKNSGTTMRLMAGVLAAQRFSSRLTGDASLSRRPMERVARPLRLRGARIEGELDRNKPGEITPPLSIGPLPEGHVLSALEYEMPLASAQVKSAILLSGLWADGPTWVREPTVTRDHTERMMRSLGVPLSCVGAMVELDPRGWSHTLPPLDVHVPGDLSTAAFLIAAAQLVPGSRVDARAVGVNPTRTGLLEVLRDMGGRVEIVSRGEAAGEPVADLCAESAELGPARMGGELASRAMDEVPVLCALAARARGISTIGDAAELRVKESDRIASMVRVLSAFGVRCEERPDGMVVEGVPDKPLSAAVVDPHGDHRIAMTAALLALCADAPSRVLGAECIAVSFPRFVGTMRALGAKMEVVE